VRASGRPTALVVLGMHRAGTSAVAGVLSALGVDFGQRLVPAAPDNNETGFWEHRDVVAVHERLLGQLGSSWHDLRPLPPAWIRSAAAQEAQADLVHILKRDFRSSAVWGVKDPRICRLLPLWSHVFARLQARSRFVIVWRHPADTAASLARRDGFSTARGLALWLTHMLAAEGATRRLRRAVVSYEDLLSDWRRSITAAGERLELRWPKPLSEASGPVEEFLDDSLCHHRRGGESDTRLPRWVAEGADLLKRVGHVDEPLDRLSALTAQLGASLSLYGPEIAPTDGEPDMAQLYLPRDGAYTEERSIRAPFAANSPEILCFRIPAGMLPPAATLRLDPAANVGLISIRRLLLRDSRGRALLLAQGRELAGVEVGGTSFRLPDESDGLRILSYADDPQLFVRVPTDITTDAALELEVALQVDRSGPSLPQYAQGLRAQQVADHALAERSAAQDRARLQADLDLAGANTAALAAHAGDLQRSVEALNAQIASSAESRTALERQAVAAELLADLLREQVARHQEARDAIARELGAAQAHVHHLSREVHTERARGDALSRELENARARTDELARGLEVSRTRAHGLSRELGGAQALTAELSREREASRAQVQELARHLEDSRIRASELARDALERDARLAAVSADLAAIRQSSLWAAASRLQTLAVTAAPRGTARYRAVKLLGAALRTVATDGLRGAVRRAARVPRVLVGGRGALEGQGGLQAWLDTPLDEPITAGRAVVVHLAGWCYHPARRVRKLWLHAEGQEVRAEYGMARPDVHADHHPDRDPRGHSFNSGFNAALTVPAGPPRSVHVQLRAALSGRAVVEVPVGTLRLVGRPEARQDTGPVPAEGPPATGPLVAICMATYNPPLDLFKAQIASLLAQSHRNWICIVSDDCSRPDLYEQARRMLAGERRVRLFRNRETLGFYGNFEAALRRVPEQAAFVCLADQDDAWHPDKLESLLQGFRPETQLVYADVNILDDRGTLVSGTYWTTRRNNYTSLESLLLANTVTGAASMFRRELLDQVLPFPARIGDSFHDHWIACVALTRGRIDYVDRPLHDYIQHGAQVLGHTAPRPRGPMAKAKRLFGEGFRTLGSRSALREFVHQGRMIYWNDVSRVKLIAATLLERLPDAPSAKRSLLGRYARLDWSPAMWARLAARGLRELAARKETTVLAELRLLHGLVAHRAFSIREALRRPRRAAVQAARAVLGESRAQVEGGVARAEQIEQKIAPLRLAPHPQAPRRINLLIPTVDFQVFFGGYIAKFHLALRLSREGYRVRVVVVDYCDFDPPSWRRPLEGFDQLSGVLDAVEFAYAFDRSRPLEVSPDDAFVASTWWTAHVAHRAARELNGRRFLYLVQEYEPFTFAMGTYSALAQESYGFPHHALFSTELLRDYFEEGALGVFQPGAVKAGARALCFRNAITEVGPVKADDLSSRRPRRLLFYARPEAHASRNMFEMGVLALCRALEQGVFDDGEWEFYGIGSAGPPRVMPLAAGRTLRLLPRVGQAEYARLLRAHDLGLSLMLTPHPSLVPIEMASAGLVVVTNTFANKSRPALEAISGNIVAVSPSIAEVADGLRRAVRRLDDYEARAREAAVQWSRSWEEAFPPTLVRALGELLHPREAAAPTVVTSAAASTGPLHADVRTE
jgi:glycosyltransferase involved in cell wall biosynthesis